ncbi:hypothetical protein ACQEU6_26605 [Spirillospora sp. CA-108201]
MTYGSAIGWGVIIGVWQIFVHTPRSRVFFIYLFGILAVASAGWTIFDSDGEGLDKDGLKAVVHFGIAAAIVLASLLFRMLLGKSNKGEDEDREIVAGRHWEDLP